MSLRPSKHDDPSTCYYMSDGTPSSKPLPINHRASFALGLPPRALVPKSNDMTFLPTQRPKLTSYPSGSANVCRDQHHPRKGQSEEDDDDGSIIVVKVPMRKTTSPSPSNVDLSKLSTGQLVKTVSKALSVDNLRGERDTYGQVYAQEKRCSSGTELKGLMEVMRLESLLLLLKKYLNLYHDFDEASGDIFMRSTHEEFFTNINQIIVDIADVARLLSTWSYNRSRKPSPQAFQIQKTLRAAYQVRERWIQYFDWKLDVFEPMVRCQQEDGGRVRRTTWEWRRRRSVEVVGGLLGLMADVEMDEGREGILDMQMGLRRRWREDGLVGVGEAGRRGWVCGVGV